MNGNLSEVSTEELLKEEKKRKHAFIMYSVAMVLITGLAVYTATHKGPILISFLPMLTFPLYINFWNRLKKIREEIKSRNASR